MTEIQRMAATVAILGATILALLVLGMSSLSIARFTLCASVVSIGGVSAAVRVAVGMRPQR